MTLRFCYEGKVIPARRSGSAKFDGSYGATVHRRIYRRTRHLLRRHRCLLEGERALHIVRETKLPTGPDVIARFVAATGLAIERIGLESDCTKAWLFAALQRYGWPATCIDARHAATALQAGFRNKNNRNDARGIADLMRQQVPPGLDKIAEGATTGPPADGARNLATAAGRPREHDPRAASPGRFWPDLDRRTAFETAVRNERRRDRAVMAFSIDCRSRDMSASWSPPRRSRSVRRSGFCGTSFQTALVPVAGSHGCPR
jgi:hypothetical protein